MQHIYYAIEKKFLYALELIDLFPAQFGSFLECAVESDNIGATNHIIGKQKQKIEELKKTASDIAQNYNTLVKEKNKSPEDKQKLKNYKKELSSTNLEKNFIIKKYTDLAYKAPTVEMIKILCEAGGKLDFISEGSTLLHEACAYNREEVVEFLLGGEEGFKQINVADKHGTLPIMLTNSVEIAKMLLSKGSNIFSTDGDNGYQNVLLSSAGKSNEKALIKFFLENGADKMVNMQDKNGCTPIMLVKNQESKKALSENGAIISEDAKEEILDLNNNNNYFSSTDPKDDIEISGNIFNALSLEEKLVALEEIYEN